LDSHITIDNFQVPIQVQLYDTDTPVTLRMELCSSEQLKQYTADTTIKHANTETSVGFNHNPVAAAD